jgi:hypothetical protein
LLFKFFSKLLKDGAAASLGLSYAPSPSPSAVSEFEFFKECSLINCFFLNI